MNWTGATKRKFIGERSGNLLRRARGPIGRTAGWRSERGNGRQGARFVILYNLFPLLAGPFSSWSEHLARAAAMGFDWVFVNPIQQVGMSGSLYSIRDYFQINPIFLDPASAAAPDEQVREMTDRTHAAGLKIMVDLVINHCAVDAPLTREHPEWFLRERDGQIAHPFCTCDGNRVVWGDLARFDHRNTPDPEGLFRYGLQVGEHLLSLGFDGFRCDAAYQVPHSFWQRFIGEIKSRHRQACFVAETLGCTADQTRKTAQAGFDFVFNSAKFWDFHSWWLIEQYNLVRETVASISFPESHDTPRLCEELHGNVHGLKQRYLFSALFSTGVMAPIGFEFGFRKQPHVVQTRPADWEQTDIDLRPFHYGGQRDQEEAPRLPGGKPGQRSALQQSQHPSFVEGLDKAPGRSAVDPQ